MTDITEKYPEGLIEALVSLRNYCAWHDYRGWNPYDGLNSKVFKAIPLMGRSAIMRLCWIQLFKRSPLNLRKIMLVPQQHNAKGVALALQAQCKMYHAVERAPRIAVMTNSGTTSKRVAEKFHFGRATSDINDILGDSAVNTVFIATRHDTHAS